MNEKWVKVGNNRIHYLAAGEGGTPVLLLHGGALDSAYISYKYSIEPLSKHFTVFAPDMPGHGKSDKPDIKYTNEFYIEFIGDFMDALALEKASIVGLSVSGASALGFALQSPRRVAKLVLADTYGLGGVLPFGNLSYFIVHTPFLLETRWAMFAWSPEVVRWSLSTIFHNPSDITNDVVDEVYRLAKEPGEGKAWISYLRSEVLWDGFRTDYRRRLEEIGVPTLIIHCANDRVVPLQLAQKAQRSIKKSNLKVIAECAHWPHRERPDDFNQAVLEFLLD